MKFSSNVVVAATLLAAMPLVCRAQEFSADVVYTHVAATPPPPSGTASQAPPPSSKIFVGKTKLRLDSRGAITLIMLVDTADHTTVAVYPGQKAYQKMGVRPAQYFRAADPGNACADWQKAAGRPLQCEKVGEELIDGRNSIRYKSTDADGSVQNVWIDTTLAFVIKWDRGKAGAELHNINVSPQSAGLFEVPDSYSGLKPTKKSPAQNGPRRS